MALKDYLLLGSYSRIETFSYTKNAKAIDATLVIYKDESLREILATKHLYFADREVAPVKVPEFITELPIDLQQGDCFFVASSVTDPELKGKERLRIKRYGDDWQMWAIVPGHVYYCTSDSKYYKLGDNELIQIEHYVDARIWYEWFDFTQEIDIARQIYKFLKSEIESFKSCIDA